MMKCGKCVAVDKPSCTVRRQKSASPVVTYAPDDEYTATDRRLDSFNRGELARMVNTLESFEWSDRE